MIYVRVLQVNTDPENIADLVAAVGRRHTDADGWQMPKRCTSGDLAVWYAAGLQKFVAWGWVEAHPERVHEGFGRYRGQVADIQAINPEIDRKKVVKDCGFDGCHQGPQYFPDEIAADFLRSVGLGALAQPYKGRAYSWRGLLSGWPLAGIARRSCQPLTAST
jgi:hypothetical protein